MNNIDRLRARLKNVQKSTTEYRMTVAEAQGLLSEIDLLIAKIKEKPSEVAVNEPTVITRTMDGGAF